MRAPELHALLEKKGFFIRGPMVAVAREKRPEKTKGGIYIPDSAVVALKYANIVMISPEIKDENLQIGDQVYMPKYSGILTKQKVPREDGSGDDIFVLELLHEADCRFGYRGLQMLDLQTGLDHLPDDVRSAVQDVEQSHGELEDQGRLH